jgi:hypothetical protein
VEAVGAARLRKPQAWVLSGPSPRPIAVTELRRYRPFIEDRGYRQGRRCRRLRTAFLPGA